MALSADPMPSPTDLNKNYIHTFHKIYAATAIVCHQIKIVLYIPFKSGNILNTE